MLSVVLPRPQRSKQFFDSLKRVVDEKENDRRRDVLRAISNPMKEREVYLSYLLEQYKKNSSALKRPTIVMEIQDVVNKIAYLDSRIDLIGWILFGPKNGRSVLRSVRDKKRLVVDDPTCLKSTLKLFEKHCGVLFEQAMKQSLANLCNYAADKEAIREAILLACGMQITESHGIDVANPKVDISPAPIHGTFQYCGRVSVDAFSRAKIQGYDKTYRVKVDPPESIPEEWHNKIRICFHGNDSLELCQCEKDDWRSIQDGSWSSIMPPYEKRFIDVKFLTGISGFVTVSLDEVLLDAVPPAQGWRSGLLVGGIALLFVAISKWVPICCYTKRIVLGVSAFGMVHIVKWATRVLALACLYMTSIDTPSPIVAICSCIALCHMIACILSKIIYEDQAVALERTWTRNSERIRRWRVDETLTERQSVADIISSGDFEGWVITNAHRIKLCPSL
ncbi:hypothetical protein L1987_84263 [Smallanthus sonchifolius]|uniref:Uncharacterized protein n=1 Tax=Smallanthus sonchifolius TaxID=185202 RepID=A0ACB8YFQ5_9ASTR|nr:hypothetical protein L1987_84263 [Smallanthus sonchifolius]